MNESSVFEVYPFFMKRIIMPVAARFSDVSIWTEYRRMMKVERLSLDELKDLQFLKLKTILAYAKQRVPFYRKRFSECGFEPEELRDEAHLEYLPPTTKDDIMAHFPDEITAQDMDRSKWKYVATSGTTRQIMGIHDFRKANINWAAGLRAHKLAGNYDVGKKWMEIPPHMCTTICGAHDTAREERFFSRTTADLLLRGRMSRLREHLYQCAYGRRQELYKRVTLPSFGSEGTNIPERELAQYIEKIRSYKPYLLEGLPLYLYAFAKYIRSKAMTPPHVGVVKPFGGSLTPHMKEIISEAFGCEVFDTYGCSETGFMACECDKHDGLHVFMDLYHVEVCRNGRLVAPGELGRLYITDLENTAMPWIRYDIGDVGRYFVEDHGCGRKSLRLHIEGRAQDTLSNSKGDLFTSDRIFDFFQGYKEIDNFQLVEKSKNNFQLLCVPSNGTGLNSERIVQEFKDFFDPSVQVKLYTVKTIKAEDGGKFRFVKSTRDVQV
jgi:phenylacetate-CoA ligase